MKRKRYNICYFMCINAGYQAVAAKVLMIYIR